jgi:hypothetical protein
MTVINYAAAAKKAGVTKQRINYMRKANADGKKRYPFFVFDPKTGKPGIDIDSKSWGEYQSADNGKRVNKKSIQKRQVSKEESLTNGNDARLESFMSVLAGLLSDKLGLSENEIDSFMKCVIAGYAEVVG